MYLCAEESAIDEFRAAVGGAWPGAASLVVTRDDEALAAVKDQQPDLVIVAGDLPGLPKTETIRAIRAFSDVLIIAAGKDEELEIVKALEFGADEHISMPASRQRIMATAVAVVRRSGGASAETEDIVLQVGDLLLNPSSHEAFVGESELMLTPTEFNLLHLLMKHRNITVSHEVVERWLWGDRADTTDTITRHVQRLRKKLGEPGHAPTRIKTVRGVGYRLVP